MNLRPTWGPYLRGAFWVSRFRNTSTLTADHCEKTFLTVDLTVDLTVKISLLDFLKIHFFFYDFLKKIKKNKKSKNHQVLLTGGKEGGGAILDLRGALLNLRGALLNLRGAPANP